MEIKNHQPGMFSWADLGTPDVEGSKRFYTELLGLDVIDLPISESMSYSMLSKDGKSSCAMYSMPDEMKAMTGGRAAWVAYFTVESADESAARIKELGGSVVREPFDVFTSGRMVIANDPTGAMFWTWEPRDHIGAQVFGEPGALAWAELYTRAPEAAAKFYGELFGWTAHATKTPDGGDYTLFHLDGKPAVGMMEIREEWGEMPPYWAIYFTVANLDASLAQVRELGGTAVSPVVEVEGVGRIAMIQDPQQAYVSLMELTR